MPRKDSESTSRTRGKDKAKDRYNKFGKYNNRSTRLHETQRTAHQVEYDKDKTDKSNKNSK